MNKNHRFETRQIHVGQENPDPATDARAVPIYATTSYVFKDSEQAAARFALAEPGNIYNRLMNPTADVFEKRIAALEGGAGALAVATGAAAIAYAVQNIARAGDHIVSAANVYGGTYNLFAHTFAESGIETTFVDGSNPDNFAKAIRENTKALYVESLDNPNCNVADIDALAEVAHARGIPLIVDNTFASPFLFRPLEHGADVVVHSATKFIGGHGTAMGGVIVDGGKFDWMAHAEKFPGLCTPDDSYHGITYAERFGKEGAFITKATAQLMRDFGSMQSPMNAYMLNLGLESLHVRMQRHCANGMAVAKFLESHPKVAYVNYCGLESSPYHALAEKYLPNGSCGVVSFGLAGGREAASTFMKELKLAAIETHVADARTCCLNPASSTHRQMNDEQLKAAGVPAELVRMSCGLESAEDLIADIAQALDKI